MEPAITTRGRRARTRLARAEKLLLEKDIVLVPCCPARHPRPVIRGIGPADGEHPLPLLHEAFLRNIITDNPHYEGVMSALSSFT
jgi:hypothetical protein